MARDPGKTQRLTLSMSADEVAAFLRDEPDFLLRYPEVVEHLLPPPHDKGQGIVDFQYFLINRLRDEVRRVREEQRDMIATTRANLNSQARIHAAALFLMDAESFEHLIQTITTDLAILLDLDVVCLIVESTGPALHGVLSSGIRVAEPGTVNHWLGRRDALLSADVLGDPALYGAGAGLVRSEALIRLHVSSAAPDGLLAFGSRDPDMFHPGQGTEQIGFLAQVVGRCIRSWLDLPA